MNQMLPHHLIERLGWTLVHSTWQIAIITAVCLLSRYWFRSPQARHGIAMLALFACLAWPAATFWNSAASPAKPIGATPAAAPSIFLQANTPPTTSEASVKQQRRSPTASSGFLQATKQVTRLASPNLMRWTVLVWFTGVLLLTTRQGLALWWLHRLRTHEVMEAPPAILALFDQAKTRLGLQRTVKFAVSARALVPVVIGSLRPVVLLPASLLSGLPTAQIEALIAHELAHLRRWDDLANWLQCMIETLLFYHPAIWWLSRLVREERELCCDDLATAQGIERRTLAKALGQLALWQAQPALAATGHMPVLARIQRLLQPPHARLPINHWPWLLIVSCLVITGWMSNAQAETPVRGRIVDRNGVVLAESPTPGERRYPLKSLAPHVIGYVASLPAKDQVKFEGRSGIEQSMNQELTAQHDVQLTLDVKAQQMIERVLAKDARNGGTVVMLDATNGDILAMASNPGFDLNEFVPKLSLERYEVLSKDKKNPLLGRAFQANYYSAPTGKLITALAGLKSGAITATTIFEGTPSFPIGDRVFRNWHTQSDGPLDVSRAMMRSCNTWFYQASLQMTASSWTEMATSLGLGTAFGLPIKGENKGFVPSDTYYQARYGHPILPGVMASMSIGQVTEVTPLQAAVATAAIANGGKVFTPRLLTSQPAAQLRTDLLDQGLKPAHFELVRQGMIACVNAPGGVARPAQVQGIEVAGIVGSTQSRIYDDSSKNQWLCWFVGFAPAQNPKIALAIVYEGAPGEHVSGGAICAPIMKQIIEQWNQESPLNGMPR